MKIKNEHIIDLAEKISKRQKTNLNILKTEFTDIYYDDLSALDKFMCTEVAKGVSAIKLTDNKKELTLLVALSKNSKVVFHRHPDSEEIVVLLAGESVLYKTDDKVEIKEINQKIAQELFIPKDVFHAFDVDKGAIQYVVIKKC